MALARKSPAKKPAATSSGHKAECCFVCGSRRDSHGNSKNSAGKTCFEFEFVPVSSRNDRDILFSAPFQSESSAKIYMVLAWRQGDYSCNCTGWRNHRTCWHIDDVKANPAKYKNKQSTAINIANSPGSVIGTVEGLNAEMAAIEAAVRRGDPIELASLQAKIDYHRAMFETAGAGLVERFVQVQTNIKNHLFGSERAVQSAPQVQVPTQHVVSDSDDPFRD